MAIIKYDIEVSYAEQFKHALSELVGRIDARRTPLRVIFFGNPLSREQYAAERYLIAEALYERYADRSPLLSYVAQPPLGATLVMEVQSLNSDQTVEFKSECEHRYAVIESEIYGRLVFTEGVLPVDISAPIMDQSREVFAVIGAILEREGLSVSDISRQWNYIEQITGMRGERQNYQEFNDARTEFYASGDWGEGYPAATGIGTSFGGVMVEIDAAHLIGGRAVSLDNSLQVAAHEYSRNVLVGSKILSTPKFERAKAIDYGNGNVKVYISGTAAIRGEQSLSGVGIVEQTVATLENIEWLCSVDNLRHYGIECSGGVSYKVFRVYLKFRSDYLVAREIIEKRYGVGLPVAYLLTDVCREELLVEVEGMATS